jgi:lipopolysaccharide/colanic/teichoic acid biosynthesis glycosyltransferase
MVRITKRDPSSTESFTERDPSLPQRAHAAHPGTTSPAGKRLFDLLLGSVFALVALPIVTVIATAMAVSLRAFPLFVHERVGRGGEPFRVIKVRTLSPVTSPYADKREIDARGKGLAGIVRRLHLDELPQLLLVPLGRMSLVGPRPEMAHLYDRMPERQGGTRLRFRPGCTGLWQISVAHGGLIADAPEYDVLYAEHRTWRMDLWILWKTALIMSGTREPIHLTDVPRWTFRRADMPEALGGDLPLPLERRSVPRDERPSWLTRVAETASRTRWS